MNQNNDLWRRQFSALVIVMEKAYNKFMESRDIEDYDIARKIYEDLCGAYSLGGMEPKDIIEIERSLRARQAPITGVVCE